MLWRSEWHLVEQQQVTLPRELFDISLQIFAAVKLRVTGIQNLNQDIAALDTPPELAPKFQVALVRRQNHPILLLHLRQAAPVMSSVFVNTFSSPKHNKAAAKLHAETHNHKRSIYI